MSEPTGASGTPEPWAEGVQPTPQQALDWLRACTDDEGTTVLAVLMVASERAERCFTLNHDLYAANLPVTSLIAGVERTARALYEDAMGQSTWPIPYDSLTVRQQEKWRGDAYAVSYDMARCVVTKTVHPWFDSACRPDCRTSPSHETPPPALPTANGTP